MKLLHKPIFWSHLTVLQSLFDSRPNRDLIVSRDIGYSLEKKNPFDELIGVFHFVDRFVPCMIGKDVVTPIFAHLRMDEVLIDAGEFLA